MRLLNNAYRKGWDLRWIVAQEGSRQTYAVPLSFHRLGQLRAMFTDIWCRRGRQLLRKGPAGCRALATRFDPDIPPELVVSFNTWAMLDRCAYSFLGQRFSPQQHASEYIRFGAGMARRVRDHLAAMYLDPERDMFFGFNTNCLETLVHLRERGVFTIVDQIDPGKVEEDLVIEESERWPGWAKVPGRYPHEYWERLQAEWAAADLTLVNSEWSKQALEKQGVPADRIIVVPLAVDLHRWKPGAPIEAKGPLKVLWLGSVILRKGIQYLVEAARLLQDEEIEFVLAGPIAISDEALKTFPPNIKVLGRITRDHLDRVYRDAHVFVLPTLSDGFAVTQLEAMSRGLPVVTTPNCGEVVTHGADGLIIPPRDSVALAGALALLNQKRDLLQHMSRNALRKIAFFDLPQNALLINELVTRYRSGQGQTIFTAAEQQNSFKA
jgi:glycosyltransferase involved in cell wall biosynthesis